MVRQYAARAAVPLATPARKASAESRSNLVRGPNLVPPDSNQKGNARPEKSDSAPSGGSLLNTAPKAVVLRLLRDEVDQRFQALASTFTSARNQTTGSNCEALSSQLRLFAAQLTQAVAKFGHCVDRVDLWKVLVGLGDRIAALDKPALDTVARHYTYDRVLRGAQLTFHETTTLRNDAVLEPDVLGGYVPPAWPELAFSAHESVLQRPAEVCIVAQAVLGYAQLAARESRYSSPETVAQMRHAMAALQLCRGVMENVPPETILGGAGAIFALAARLAAGSSSASVRDEILEGASFALGELLPLCAADEPAASPLALDVAELLFAQLSEAGRYVQAEVVAVRARQAAGPSDVPRAQRLMFRANLRSYALGHLQYRLSTVAHAAGASWERKRVLTSLAEVCSLNDADQLLNVLGGAQVVSRIALVSGDNMVAEFAQTQVDPLPVSEPGLEPPVSVAVGVASFNSDTHMEPKRVRQVLNADLLILLRAFWSDPAALLDALVLGFDDISGLRLKRAPATLRSMTKELNRAIGEQPTVPAVRLYRPNGTGNAAMLAGRELVEMVPEQIATQLLRLAFDLVVMTPRVVLPRAGANDSSGTTAAAAAAAAGVAPVIAEPPANSNYATVLVTRMYANEDRIGRYMGSGGPNSGTATGSGPAAGTLSNAVYLSFSRSIQHEVSQKDGPPSPWRFPAAHVDAESVALLVRHLWHLSDLGRIRTVWQAVDLISKQLGSSRLNVTLSSALHCELALRCHAAGLFEAVTRVKVVHKAFLDAPPPLTAVGPKGKAGKAAAAMAAAAAAVAVDATASNEPQESPESIGEQPLQMRALADAYLGELAAATRVPPGTLGGPLLVHATRLGVELVAEAFGALQFVQGAPPAAEAAQLFSFGSSDATPDHEWIQEALTVLWRVAQQTVDADAHLGFILGCKLALWHEKRSNFQAAIHVLETLVADYQQRPGPPNEGDAMLVDATVALLRNRLQLDYDAKRAIQRRGELQAYTLRHKVAASKPTVSELPTAEVLAAFAGRSRVGRCLLLLATATFGYNLTTTQRWSLAATAGSLLGEERTYEKQFAAQAVSGGHGWSSVPVISDRRLSSIVVTPRNNPDSLTDGSPETGMDDGAWFAVFCKPSLPVGQVSVNHVEFLGCGVPLRIAGVLDGTLSIAAAPTRVTLRGLAPNERYVVSLLACTSTGAAAGGATMRQASLPFLAARPLPLRYMEALYSQLLVRLPPPTPAREALVFDHDATVAHLVTAIVPELAGEFFKWTEQSSSWDESALKVILGQAPTELTISVPSGGARTIDTEFTPPVLAACVEAVLGCVQHERPRLDKLARARIAYLMAHRAWRHNLPTALVLQCCFECFNAVIPLVAAGIAAPTTTPLLLGVFRILAPQLARIEPSTRQQLVDELVVPVASLLASTLHEAQLYQALAVLVEEILPVLEPFGDAAETKISSSTVLEHSWFGARQLALLSGAPESSGKDAARSQIAKGKRIIWYTEYLFHALLATSSKTGFPALPSRASQLKEYLWTVHILNPVFSVAAVGSSADLGSVVPAASSERRILDPVVTLREVLVLVRLNQLETLYQELGKFRKNPRWLELAALATDAALRAGDSALCLRFGQDVFESLEQRDVALYQFGKEYEGRAQRLFSSRPAPAGPPGHQAALPQRGPDGRARTSANSSVASSLALAGAPGTRRGAASVAGRPDLLGEEPDDTDESSDGESDHNDAVPVNREANEASAARAAAQPAPEHSRLPTVTSSEHSGSTQSYNESGSSTSGAEGDNVQATASRRRPSMTRVAPHQIERAMLATSTKPGVVREAAEEETVREKPATMDPSQTTFPLETLAKLAVGQDTSAMSPRQKRDFRNTLLARIPAPGLRSSVARALTTLDGVLAPLWQSSRYRRRARALAEREGVWRAKVCLTLAVASLEQHVRATAKRVAHAQTSLSGTTTIKLAPAGFWQSEAGPDGAPVTQKPAATPWDEGAANLWRLPATSAGEASNGESTGNAVQGRKGKNATEGAQWTKLQTRMLLYFRRAAVLAARFGAWNLVLAAARGLWTTRQLLLAHTPHRVLAARCAKTFAVVADRALEAVVAIEEQSASQESDGASIATAPCVRSLTLASGRTARIDYDWLRSFCFTALIYLRSEGLSLSFLHLAAEYATAIPQALHREMLPQLAPWVATVAHEQAERPSADDPLATYRRVLVTKAHKALSECPSAPLLEQFGRAVTAAHVGDSSAAAQLEPLISCNDPSVAAWALYELAQLHDARGNGEKATQCRRGAISRITGDQVTLTGPQLQAALASVVKSSAEDQLLVLTLLVQLAVASQPPNALGARSELVRAAGALLSSLCAQFPEAATARDRSERLASVLQRPMMQLRLSDVLCACWVFGAERLAGVRTRARARDPNPADACELAEQMGFARVLAEIAAIGSVWCARFALLEAQALASARPSHAVALGTLIQSGALLSRIETVSVAGIISGGAPASASTIASVASALPAAAFSVLPISGWTRAQAKRVEQAFETFLCASVDERAVFYYGTIFFDVEFQLAQLQLVIDLVELQGLEYDALRHSSADPPAWDAFAAAAPSSAAPSDDAAVSLAHQIREITAAEAEGGLAEAGAEQTGLPEAADEEVGPRSTASLRLRFANLVETRCKALWARLAASDAAWAPDARADLALAVARHYAAARLDARAVALLLHVLGNFAAGSAKVPSPRPWLALRLELVHALQRCGCDSTALAHAVEGRTEAVRWGSAAFAAEFGVAALRIGRLRPDEDIPKADQELYVSLCHHPLAASRELCVLLGRELPATMALPSARGALAHVRFQTASALQALEAGDDESASQILRQAHALLLEWVPPTFHGRLQWLQLVQYLQLRASTLCDDLCDRAQRLVRSTAQTQSWNFALALHVALSAVARCATREPTERATLVAHWSLYAVLMHQRYARLAAFRARQPLAVAQKALRTAAPWIADLAEQESLHQHQHELRTAVSAAWPSLEQVRRVEAVQADGTVNTLPLGSDLRADTFLDTLLASLKRRCKSAFDGIWRDPATHLAESDAFFALDALLRFLGEHVPALRTLQVTPLAAPAAGSAPVSDEAFTAAHVVPARAVLAPADISSPLVSTVLVVVARNARGVAACRALQLIDADLVGLQNDLAGVMYLLNQHEMLSSPPKLAEAQQSFSKVCERLERLLSPAAEPLPRESTLELSKDACRSLQTLFSADSPAWSAVGRALDGSPVALWLQRLILSASSAQ